MQGFNSVRNYSFGGRSGRSFPGSGVAKFGERRGREVSADFCKPELEMQRLGDEKRTFFFFFFFFIC